MSDGNIAIAGLISTVIAGFGGAFLGAIISYRYSVRLFQRQEFNKAATKFREAFMPVREVLNPAEFALKEELAIFLEDRFLEHRRAVMEFSDFLDAETKTAFLDAWHEYYRHPGHRDENRCHSLAFLYLSDGTVKGKNEKKQLAKIRIEKLLNFAKPR